MASYKDTKTGREYPNVSAKAEAYFVSQGLISSGRYVLIGEKKKPAASKDKKVIVPDKD